MRNILILLLLTPLLAACAGSPSAGATPDKPSEGFSESMRWSDFPGAAAYMAPDVRDAFLDQFNEDDDLHIVDSSVTSIAGGPDSKQIDVIYVMEYYHLPSSQIKKWRWTQHWRLIVDEASKSEAWLIDNEPPTLPWRE